MTGTERKVFQKYYPPDYDPSKIPRAKGRKNRQFVQRVMTPFNMQCNTCHEYIYKGKKFNMKRETVDGETYLGLKLFRFYFKCPNCLAEITFKTDLENCDYQNEHGATRLFEAFKLYQDAEKQREAQEEEDKKDPMKMLEKRTMMSRAEMEAMGNLEDLQEISRQKEGVNVDVFLHDSDPSLSLAEKLKRQEEEDEAFIRNLYGKTEDGRIIKRLADEDEDIKPSCSQTRGIKNEVDLKPTTLNESIGKTSKRMVDQKSLLAKMVVVKRTKVEIKEEVQDGDVEPLNDPTKALPHVPAIINEPTKLGSLTGLIGYGSGSDSD